MNAFLARNDAFSIQPITAEEIPDLPMALDRQNNLRTLPSMLPELGGIDGFFASRLEKSAN